MFPCTMCGVCCKNIPVGALEVREGTTICKNLSEDDRTCNIYESRPLICRIDDMIGRFYRHEDKAKLYRQTAKACNALMDKDGIDERYRVRL